MLEDSWSYRIRNKQLKFIRDINKALILQKIAFSPNSAREPSHPYRNKAFLKT